jgi:hypothetical protein
MAFMVYVFPQQEFKRIFGDDDGLDNLLATQSQGPLRARTFSPYAEVDDETAELHAMAAGVTSKRFAAFDPSALHREVVQLRNSIIHVRTVHICASKLYRHDLS